MYVCGIALNSEKLNQLDHLNVINRSDSYIIVYSYKGIFDSSSNEESQLCVSTMINLKNNTEKLIAGYVERDH